MINRKKYSFYKYSDNYEKLFNREKLKLRKILPSAEIEHVGSTSVKGLGGKGIIDIAIKTPPNKENQFVKHLAKLGYASPKEHPRNSKRIFLKRAVKYAGKERHIHIHLVLNRKFWDSFILVRDYLSKNRDSREKYAKIKKEAIKYARGDGKKYREYKNDFLEDILRRAKKE